MPDMKRYLVEFELESHSCLIDGLGEQKLASEDDGVEYLLSNLSTEIGNEHPILCLRILLEAPDFGTAEGIGKEKATRFVRCLSFSASMPCKIHRMTRIIDWTPGLPEREAQMFTSHRGHDLPYKVIDDQLLRTVEGLISLNIKDETFQALKWHYYGVVSEFTDEKFQYFWLSLETLVQVNGDATKVNDPCAKCGSPLYCKNCETHPTHRPYQKQKIETFCKKINPDSGQKIFDDASEVRDVISHGRDVTAFVQKAGIKFEELVNAMGQMSFSGILNSFQSHSGLKQEKNKYLFLQVNSFIKTTLTVGTQIFFPSKDPNAPNISDVPNPKVELQISETE